MKNYLLLRLLLSMKSASILLSLCLLSLVGCSEGFHPQSLMTKVLIMPASDFGPEAMSASWLGAGGQSDSIVIHYGLSQRYLTEKYPAHRYANVVPTIKHLNQSIKTKPHDADAVRLHTRLVATRSRLIEFYNTRRVAFNSVPPFVGRGFMARQALMPAIGTTR
jgi:ribosomal protein S15P/S13E